MRDSDQVDPARVMRNILRRSCPHPLQQRCWRVTGGGSMDAAAPTIALPQHHTSTISSGGVGTVFPYFTPDTSYAHLRAPPAPSTSFFAVPSAGSVNTIRNVYSSPLRNS